MKTEKKSHFIEKEETESLNKPKVENKKEKQQKTAEENLKTAAHRKKHIFPEERV